MDHADTQLQCSTNSCRMNFIFRGSWNTFQNKTSNMFVAIQMAIAAWVYLYQKTFRSDRQFSQVAHNTVSIHAKIIAFLHINNQPLRRKSGKHSHSQQKEYLGTSLVH